MKRQVILTAFSTATVQALAAAPVATRVPTMMLGVIGPSAAQARALGRAVALNQAFATSVRVAEYHAAGLEVYVWTPNTDAELNLARAAGADFLISDRAVRYCAGRQVCR
jgi:glycerophosphoryl diester phosphodiesterase